MIELEYFINKRKNDNLSVNVTAKGQLVFNVSFSKIIEDIGIKTLSIGKDKDGFVYIDFAKNINPFKIIKHGLYKAVICHDIQKGKYNIEKISDNLFKLNPKFIK